MILITGGAGFVGTNFIYQWFEHTSEPLVNLDALTYAGNVQNLAPLSANPHYHFVHGNVCDKELVTQVLQTYRPRAIIHMAAESHVDRSIAGPEVFFQTNVLGTVNMLTCAQVYYESLAQEQRSVFRFLHVSTDEVYGSLGPDEAPFTEDSPHRPNSPYSASKAASDDAVRAWHRTYGLPTLTTNCSNNYGPYQFPEKLIPLVITRALAHQPIPVYGDGTNVRDWLHVNDHCAALRLVLEKGRVGETYNIGSNTEVSNNAMVELICRHLDVYMPWEDGSYGRLITYVPDRPGHDRRYAISAAKLRAELSWLPQLSFEDGMRQCVETYCPSRQGI